MDKNEGIFGSRHTGIIHFLIEYNILLYKYKIKTFYYQSPSFNSNNINYFFLLLTKV